MIANANTVLVKLQDLQSRIQDQLLLRIRWDCEKPKRATQGRAKMCLLFNTKKTTAAFVAVYGAVCVPAILQRHSSFFLAALTRVKLALFRFCIRKDRGSKIEILVHRVGARGARGAGLNAA